MMLDRGFRFRIWDARENARCFHCPNDYMIDGEGIVFHSVLGLCGGAEFLTFEQYTGLRDKNGSLIYEGDILKYKKSFVENFKTACGAVKYSNIAARWKIAGCLFLNKDFAEECEVVGNIHENPELLEEKK